MRMRAIGGIFGRPAFGALYEHMLKVQDCLSLLEPMMLSFTRLEFNAARRYAYEIHQRENEADAIKNEIRAGLSRSIFTAVERTEMLLLLKAQDDVSDDCERVASLVEIRDTAVWPEIAVDFMQLAARVVQVGRLLGQVEEKLKDVEGTAYLHGELEKLSALIDQVQQGEHDTGRLQQTLLSRLFQNETRTDPVSVIFLMQIAQQMSAIVGAAENTSDVLGRMIGMR